MLRRIFQENDPILRQRQPYFRGDEKQLAQILQDLKDTLVQSDAIGFAANQIGEPYKICIVGLDTVLINPEIIWHHGRRYSKEGCMSIPGYSAAVPRSLKIRVRVDMPRRIVTLSGEAATIAQHEIDHLEGILIRDYVERTHGKKGGILISEYNPSMQSAVYFTRQ